MSSEKSGKIQKRSNNNTSQNSNSLYDYSNSNLYNRNKNLNHNYNNNYSSNRSKKPSFKNEKKSNSNKVLTDILDNKKKFNIYSPSQLKQMIDELKIIEKQKKLEENISKKNYSIREDEEKNIYLIDSISKCLLQINKLNPKFMEMEISNKIIYMIHFINNEDLKIRLGSIIIEYFLLKNNFEELNETIKNDILKNILNYLHNSYESQEELFLVSCLNILSLYDSSYEYLIDSISLIAMFLTDFEYPYLQRASFICLINLGDIGLQTLINIAIKEEYQDYQKYILNSLIKTPFIQRLCIIKSLMNEIKTNDINRRIEAFSALNRFYDVLNNDKINLEELSNKLSDEKYKNYQIYIASILKCAGNNGLYYLIDNLEKSESSKKREIICKILGYKFNNNPDYIDIVLDNNDIQSNNFIQIGQLWKYYGDVEPLLNEKNNGNKILDEDDLDSIEFMYDIIQENKENKRNILLVSSRDFLTALQRLMKENIDYENFEIVNKNEKKNILDELNLSILYDKDDHNNIKKEEFKLKLIDSINQKININIFKKYKDIFINEIEEEETEEYNSANKNVIKYLCYHLNDYDEKVRLASSISLGRISKPDGESSIKEILKVINVEKNISVLSSMLWALGKNLNPSNIEIIPILIKYIQTDIWKVRRIALFALSKFGSIAAEQAIPTLSKLLIDSPINKSLIAEVIVSMGNLGENKLLEIIEKNDKNDKLISSITKSFSYVNLNSNNISNIIQLLCQKLYGNPSSIIRKNCLFSLRKLSNRLKKYNPDIDFGENDKYVYLTEKNIIPLFYEKLKDKEFKIQKYAIDCILEFGPKGELIFLEGLLKDKSPIVRLNCAIGLCLSGVHTFRTLINKGLFDNNKSVRTNIQGAILHFFNIDDIVDYFKKKEQLMSLKILLEEYLEKGEDITENFLNFSQILIEQITSEINY